MAIVSNPREAFNRVDADRRVRHPLHAIRGYIRRYVLLEGIALAVLYLGLVFWIALLIDYGPWKLLSFDWLWQADELSGSQTTRLLRLVILMGVLAGLGGVVVFKVVRRLFKRDALNGDLGDELVLRVDERLQLGAFLDETAGDRFANRCRAVFGARHDILDHRRFVVGMLGQRFYLVL